MKVRQERIRVLSLGKKRSGPIAYWMSRDQRVSDNWALLFAQERALQLKRPLIVIFCLVSDFLGATIRHYGFMLKGLEGVEGDLAKKNISFFMLRGRPRQQIPRFIKKNRVSELVTDFDPLRIKRQWKKDVVSSIDIPFYEVDAHNIVPCWLASVKQEFGAYTIRPKINKKVGYFLEEFPKLKTHPFKLKSKSSKANWDRIKSGLRVDRFVGEVGWIAPGENQAKLMLRRFIDKKLVKYPLERNDPTIDGQSNLSPYLHFGQLSAGRVALGVKKAKVAEKIKDIFLEELIVRRELADNFCFYNKNYDKAIGFPAWAQTTLKKHKRDKRQYLYSVKELEQGRTHDDLWNTAQKQMVITGKMHGYMRMYWAKKILEWTPSVQTAMQIAIKLNDKYELDGRDPNGYVGISWSLGGVHDRAWPQHSVFGKVRYMSYNGCKSKFKVSQYINNIQKLKGEGK